MSRGGKREGAGQKPKWKNGETRSIRVPIALAEEIMRLAKLVDEGEKLWTLEEARKVIAKEKPIEKIVKKETETQSKVIDLGGISLTATAGVMAVKLEDLVKRGYELKPERLQKITTEVLKSRDLRK